MKTLSVQQIGTGFELETPSFWLWVKAGMAFTLGAGIVTVVSMLAWWMVGLATMAAIFGRRLH